MKCTLCQKEIENYTPIFNRLKISESHSVYICQLCSDKFIKWQQRNYAILFPTKALKKRFKDK